MQYPPSLPLLGRRPNDGVDGAPLLLLTLGHNNVLRSALRYGLVALALCLRSSDGDCRSFDLQYIASQLTANRPFPFPFPV